MRRTLTCMAAALATMSIAGCARTAEETVHPNEELFREGYDAFNRKDIQAVMELFSDDITFIVPGRNIQAGTFKGKSEIQGFFSRIGQFTGGTHRLEILDLLADDSRVFVRLRALGEHDGESFDMPVLHLWKVSNGKATELSLIPTDQYRFDEFWSEESATSQGGGPMMADSADIGAHAAHDAYINAINSNDLDKYLATITDDIVYLPPNSSPIVGKSEVGSWSKAYFDAFHTQWVKKTIEFVVQGDLAYEWYAYQATDTPRDGGDVTTDSGNGVNIYRRGADGTWRVWRDIWATDRPAS